MSGAAASGLPLGLGVHYPAGIDIPSLDTLSAEPEAICGACRHPFPGDHREIDPFTIPTSLVCAIVLTTGLRLFARCGVCRRQAL